MKRKLVETLGTFGYVLYFAIMVFISALPFAFIDVHWLLTALFIIIEVSFVPSAIVFWIWGFIIAVNGKQDAWAIIYYICFACMMLPAVISTVAPFFAALFDMIKNRLHRNKYDREIEVTAKYNAAVHRSVESVALIKQLTDDIIRKTNYGNTEKILNANFKTTENDKVFLYGWFMVIDNICYQREIPITTDLFGTCNPCIYYNEISAFYNKQPKTPSIIPMMSQYACDHLVKNGYSATFEIMLSAIKEYVNNVPHMQSEERESF